MFMSINNIRKAKYHTKKLIADRKKLCKFEDCANLEPAKKKIRLDKAASKYKSMDVVKKKIYFKKMPKNTSLWIL